MSLVRHLLSNTKLLVLVLVLALPLGYFFTKSFFSILGFLAERSWILLLVAFLAVIGYLAYRGSFSGLSLPAIGGGNAQDEKAVAKTFAGQLFPKEWKLVQWFRLDSDGDDVDEHLLVFRYNYRAGDKKHPDVGPVGGVIYDPVNNPSTEGPEKAPDLLSGMLLPDVAGGKGQGYLAERKVVPLLCAMKSGAPELVIFGFGSDPWPTSLSIFRWDGKRYATLGHWVGDGGIEVTPESLVPDANEKVGDTPLECKSPVKSVRVRTRLRDRDVLCREDGYSRDEAGQRFSGNGPTISFCYHVPEHPFYPEGAVVAFYETLREKGADAAQKAYLDDAGQKAWKQLSENHPVKGSGKVRLLMIRYPPGFSSGATDLRSGMLFTVTVKVDTGQSTYQTDWGVAGRYRTKDNPKLPVEWRLHSVKFR